MKLVELFPELSLNPSNAKDIKQLILQLAIEGKLTRKWRKENPQKAWSTFKLIELCTYIQRGKSPKYVDRSALPVVSQKCVQWSGFDISKARYIDELSINTYNEERFLQEDDLLWNSTGDGTLGRTALYYEANFKTVVADSHVTVVRANKELLNPKYLQLYTSSSSIQNLIQAQSSGSTKQTELSTSTIKSLEIITPSIKEQQAIVSNIESLFKEVDELEGLTKQRIELKRSYTISALNRLSEADTEKEWKQIVSVFPEIFNDKETIKTLRETILQLAVQGKLTAKWRAENPTFSAFELLDQIKVEKARLIREKRIKAEKPLPPIEGNEIPFELPESWVWCRLGDASMQITDGEHQTPPRLKNGRILLSAKNIRNGFIDYDNCDYISEENFRKSIKRCHPEKGDLLVVSVGGTIGRISMVEKEIPFALVRSVAMIKNKNLIPNYLRWVMNSPLLQESIEIRKRGGAQPCLYLSEIREFKFPLASISEQIVIVEKVDALMALCDELEINITSAKQQNELLLQQVLKESLQPKVEIENIEQKSISNLRQQLALHIIYKSAADPSFGKTKFEKLLHLSDYHIIKQDWGQKYERHTAGPLDTIFTYPFLGTAESMNLISYEVKGNLERICANKSVIEKQLKENPLPKEIADQVDKLIDKFIGHNYETPEIVSTLYAVWNNRILRKEEITDELLKADFLAWDKQKLRYKDRLDKVIKTMREEGLVPDGWGKVIDKKN